MSILTDGVNVIKIFSSILYELEKNIYLVSSEFLEIGASKRPLYPYYNIRGEYSINSI